ncbi:MAG: preprotein translocase subunit SecY [Oceanospirillaceae bacterium]|uniref:preprotein translocase subunit SecY n=1 Tax=Thalassolituus sp. UBA1505 TaxID=1947653 RepID=UPI000C0A47DB|nr:preprotein translocase subunit SecY [Thalassolituus sp. UBA1505]MAK92403.1 preprotein translocase subunit SecY [Thalassolituus sp.]MAS25147.1 preprotein translocase subunit SecY [Oceanospirillaceae bacterium]MBS54006.1 preprotein translocase subunit SecY [Oceanospirillaceae bacterium]|tara:strand:- start:7072 stop:8391 length:1320 start_codon:yes stop_codon:yes gene_type:complete
MARQGLPQGMQSGLGELWARIRFVFLAIVVYRIGTHIPVPGINPEQLARLFEQNQGTILEMFNMFSGGALERMSILALGIMPYISASIIMQLLTAVSPQLEQLKKEGEAGRRKITQYTRYGTVLLATVQGFGVSAGLAGQGVTFSTGIDFYITAVPSFVAGAVFMMWLGEQVTERGIGNGISILIFAGIVAGLPSAIGQAFESARQGDLNIVVLLAIAVVAVLVIGFVVFVERGQRRITINYAKRQQGRQMFAAQTSHLPLKLNMAGVIPAIFASSLLLFPASLGQWFGQGEGMEWLQDISMALAPSQPLYIIMFAAGIIFFCYFYTALMFNPKDVAENLKKSGAFIPGIRPGIQTAKYIDGVLGRLTLFGSLYIAAVCLMPQFLVVAADVPFYFGGTSLLIVVVVVMDFMAQVQSHLMSHQYESLMKKANLKNFGSTR